MYVQNHIPVKMRSDLMLHDIEALWLQIHLPQVKPILVGCCYRPPSADMIYLDKNCQMLDKASDENRELYFMGELNKLLHYQQELIKINLSSKCIDHFFTNFPEHCSVII